MLGEPLHEPVRRRTPQPRRQDNGSLEGEVLTIDRFGNVITNLVARNASRVAIAGQQVRVVRTYGEAEPGELVALVGSSGFIEIAVRDGSAAAVWKIARGQRAVLYSE